MAKLVEKMKKCSVIFLAIALSGCATIDKRPPSQTADACAIIDEKGKWKDPIFDAAQEWKISPGTILAFMRQESGFRHDARPLDRNGRPVSSAYGFSQALDGTWAQYERENGQAKRKRFRDSADFIGWYLDNISKTTRISKSDARSLYLAYHEGPAGYRRGTYNSKSWLLSVANRVGTQSSVYDNQLRRCEARKMRQFDRIASR